MSRIKVGILALQGDFELHRRMFLRLGAEPVLVRTAEELQSVDRLVIPGGESTTMQLLIDRYSLRQPLTEYGKNRPLWGTCAGLILLSNRVDDPAMRPLGMIDITSSRNAYGRQVNSFVDTGKITLRTSERPFEMVFIRAPKIVEFGEDVIRLGECRGEVTMAERGNILVTAFHPELTDDPFVHEYFLDL